MSNGTGVTSFQVIAAIRVLVWWCSQKEKHYAWWGIAEPFARRVLGMSVNRSNPEKGIQPTWYLALDWKQRLEAAGINPETWELEDWTLLKSAMEEFRATSGFDPFSGRTLEEKIELKKAKKEARRLRKRSKNV